MCKRNALLTLATYPELRAALGGVSAVPDFRGLFLRGFGSKSHAQENGSTIGVTSTTHSSGGLGAVQGDASRNVTGEIASVGQTELGAYIKPNSCFYAAGQNNNVGIGIVDSNNQLLGFDASLVVPTANENRPVNTAVRYLIRALP
jgi:hypothetical protein